MWAAALSRLSAKREPSDPAADDIDADTSRRSRPASWSDSAALRRPEFHLSRSQGTALRQSRAITSPARRSGTSRTWRSGQFY